MPTQNNEDRDKISLVVAGKVRTNWSRYSVDSDFLKAADGWQLSLGLPDKVFPTDIVRGAPVQLQVGVRPSSAVALMRFAAWSPGRITPCRSAGVMTRASLLTAPRRSSAPIS